MPAVADEARLLLAGQSAAGTSLLWLLLTFLIWCREAQLQPFRHNARLHVAPRFSAATAHAAVTVVSFIAIDICPEAVAPPNQSRAALPWPERCHPESSPDAFCREWR